MQRRNAAGACTDEIVHRSITVVRRAACTGEGIRELQVLIACAGCKRMFAKIDGYVVGDIERFIGDLITVREKICTERDLHVVLVAGRMISTKEAVELGTRFSSLSV